ncbi:type VII secretion protein EccC [Mycolicibacterium agri]|uniref:Putative FtsK/SpoIIIE family protein n=1 Tax=Mycolicibacterium agri TaxID=36811 RepID=A0A2A7MYG9_MYCAG|nr:type VII secretion protein EccCa [Mycolicibacterium agri]PEG36600.1 type VII secretion protein EccC [Mycolicibacterium agri]GFG51978.1 putative FtsK/SpoIIIE family protein [Mycolicibacterium agri]
MEFVTEPRLDAPPTDLGEVVVRPPPEVRRDAPANPLARLLPLALMVATVGMMVFYFTSGATVTRNPMFMFFPVMMLGSLLGTVVFGARGGNRTAEINMDRRDYLRYLASLDVTITKTAENQHRSLWWRHPDPTALWTLVGTRRMWERTPDDVDFGQVRVGTASQDLSTPLVSPELGPVEDLDPVTTSELRRLIRRRSTVADLPVALELNAAAAYCIDGETSAGRALARAMVCQLAVLHSPAHLRIVAVVDALTGAEWEWLKWLPHHQHPHATDDAGAARMTYTSLTSAEAALNSECRVVVVIDGGLATREHAASSASAAATLLELGTSCHDIADRNGMRLTVTRDALIGQSSAGDQTAARPDGMTTGQALACARRISAFRPAAVGEAAAVTSAAWPDLMGIGDIGRLDPVTVWRRRSAGRRLRVPIGVCEQGLPVELDIKEAAANGMGPHGLCIGATGSGKSEFLRTLTLGMITAHPPETLNLVLVDFKGGATFLGFERAPHVAAVITNLADEAHLVARMKDAIAGEMNRRQELLRTAGNFANLAEYERARAAGRGLAPLPVLFIVVDEFSELLSQHPDFIDLFIAVGRLGRSLGMHLLLASQRLDEGRLRGLESHLSYRICLKTFSTSESRAVLGVPDAYHLPSNPGAAFLKTGSEDPRRFQTAYVSGPYTERSSREADPAVAPVPRLFTAAPMGRVTVASEQTAESVSSRTTLEAALDRLQGYGPPAHRVWLPPLTEPPMLDTLLQHTGAPASLTVPIGLVDCPFEQRRDLLIAQLGGAAGNVAVVGGPRSGKSTAVCTLIAALAETHDPSEVQIYCLDFGGGTLSSLLPLPHVGSVAGRRDAELVRRTVVHLESLLRARETEPVSGHVFLVIDGWATVRQEFETLESTITALAARGLSYGIHVVVAASRWAEIRPALKDQIGTRIELRLGDPAESEMDRKRARQLMQSPPGRGITHDGREFVIALPKPDAACVDRLHARYGGHVAPPIEILPTRVELDAIAERFMPSRPATEILLGIGEADLSPVAVNFGAEAHFVVLGEGECGKTATLRTLCREIVRTNTPRTAQLFIVDYRRALLGVVETDHLAGYTPSAAAIAPQVTGLLERLAARMPGAEVTQQQLRERSWWSGPELYVVIDDYDLVATANGTNPLAPLLDYLPYAKDLGLHIVVARRSGGAARALFDPVLSRLRDLGCMGLMMSASPDEGVLLGSVRPSPLPPGRGTFIRRSHADELVQVAWSDPA